MAKYIRLFENHESYEDWKLDDQDYVKPNVSMCREENELHYNPIATPLILTMRQDHGTSYLQILGDSLPKPNPLELFDSIKVNGVDVDLELLNENNGSTHTEDVATSDRLIDVEYILKDPTTIPSETFSYYCNVVSVQLPNSITTIGDRAFCSNNGPMDTESINAIQAINPNGVGYCGDTIK